MSQRIAGVNLWAAAIAAAFLISGTAAGQSAKVKTASKPWALPRTPDGQPDLQGVWTNATITPLERPADLAGKEFLTEAEAADFEKSAFAQINSERRDGGPEVDVGRSYNEFWRDRGTKVVANSPNLAHHRSVRWKNSRARHPLRRKYQADARAYQRLHPADGPEDRNLWERCLDSWCPHDPETLQ